MSTFESRRPPNTGPLRSAVVYIQRRGRSPTSFWKDLQYCRNNGATTIGNPTSVEITHIIVELPNKPEKEHIYLLPPTTNLLPPTTPTTFNTDREEDWTLNRLVHHFARDSKYPASQGPVLVQSNWLQDSVKAGYMLGPAARWGGWMVRGAIERPHVSVRDPSRDPRLKNRITDKPSNDSTSGSQSPVEPLSAEGQSSITNRNPDINSAPHDRVPTGDRRHSDQKDVREAYQDQCNRDDNLLRTWENFYRGRRREDAQRGRERYRDESPPRYTRRDGRRESSPGATRWRPVAQRRDTYSAWGRSPSPPSRSRRSLSPGYHRLRSPSPVFDRRRSPIPDLNAGPSSSTYPANIMSVPIDRALESNLGNNNIGSSGLPGQTTPTQTAPTPTVPAAQADDAQTERTGPKFITLRNRLNAKMFAPANNFNTPQTGCSDTRDTRNVNVPTALRNVNSLSIDIPKNPPFRRVDQVVESPPTDTAGRLKTTPSIVSTSVPASTLASPVPQTPQQIMPSDQPMVSEYTPLSPMRVAVEYPKNDTSLDLKDLEDDVCRRLDSMKPSRWFNSTSSSIIPSSHGTDQAVAGPTCAGSSPPSYYRQSSVADSLFTERQPSQAPDLGVPPDSIAAGQITSTPVVIDIFSALQSIKPGTGAYDGEQLTTPPPQNRENGDYELKQEILDGQRQYIQESDVPEPEGFPETNHSPELTPIFKAAGQSPSVSAQASPAPPTGIEESRVTPATTSASSSLTPTPGMTSTSPQPSSMSGPTPPETPVSDCALQQVPEPNNSVDSAEDNKNFLFNVIDMTMDDEDDDHEDDDKYDCDSDSSAEIPLRNLRNPAKKCKLKRPAEPQAAMGQLSITGQGSARLRVREGTKKLTDSSRRPAKASSQPADRILPEQSSESSGGSQQGIFAAGKRHPMTFHVLVPEARTKSALERLITFEGGGDLAEVGGADCIILPVDKGMSVTDPELCAAIRGNAFHPAAQVISRDWLFDCIGKHGRILDVFPYLIDTRAIRESRGTQPDNIPKVTGKKRRRVVSSAGSTAGPQRMRLRVQETEPNTGSAAPRPDERGNDALKNLFSDDEEQDVTMAEGSKKCKQEDECETIDDGEEEDELTDEGEDWDDDEGEYWDDDDDDGDGEDVNDDDEDENPDDNDDEDDENGGRYSITCVDKNHRDAVRKLIAHFKKWNRGKKTDSYRRDFLQRLTKSGKVPRAVTYYKLYREYIHQEVPALEELEDQNHAEPQRALTSKAQTGKHAEKEAESPRLLRSRRKRRKL